MQSRSKKTYAAQLCASLIALVALGNLPAQASDSSLTQGAKKVGTTVGTVVRDVGKEGKKVGLAVGHEAKHVGLAVGHAAEAGGVAAWHAVKGQKQ
ncbi:MAG: hypothetical protein ACYCSR_07815 [Thiomonas sp.]|uniref:Putative Lipoprotein n=1 Tax=mine drainage metagenome TaxID=410659 RepID=E6PW37_9ZZZZ